MPCIQTSCFQAGCTPLAGIVDASPSRTVTFTTALDIYSLLPAVKKAGQIGIKNLSSRSKCGRGLKAFHQYSQWTLLLLVTAYTKSFSRWHFLTQSELPKPKRALLYHIRRKARLHWHGTTVYLRDIAIEMISSILCEFFIAYLLPFMLQIKSNII